MYWKAVEPKISTLVMWILLQGSNASSSQKDTGHRPNFPQGKEEGFRIMAKVVILCQETGKGEVKTPNGLP